MQMLQNANDYQWALRANNILVHQYNVIVISSKEQGRELKRFDLDRADIAGNKAGDTI